MTRVRARAGEARAGMKGKNAEYAQDHRFQRRRGVPQPRRERRAQSAQPGEPAPAGQASKSPASEAHPQRVPVKAPKQRPSNHEYRPKKERSNPETHPLSHRANPPRLPVPRPPKRRRRQVPARGLAAVCTLTAPPETQRSIHAPCSWGMDASPPSRRRWPPALPALVEFGALEHVAAEEERQ